MTTIPGAPTFPSEPPPKKSRFRARGHFWGSPLFLAVFGHSHVRRATTLNFGPISTKLEGIVRVIKKNDPEGQRTRSGPELRRNGRFYVRPKSGFWPKKWVLPQKNHPKMTLSLLIIWAKALFFFEQLFPVVARTWLVTKSERLFLGPKFQFLAKKIRFLPYDPNFR